MSLARAWEDAGDAGFPPEVAAVIATAERSDWSNLRLLLAVPEFKVELPGGSRASQTDLVVLARGSRGLVAFAIEGKVDESFGPTVAQQRAKKSAGVEERMRFLLEQLGVTSPCPGRVRYQLLHRTFSALHVAREFCAESAVMLVHSFSPTSRWLDDFQAFARLFHAEAEPGRLLLLGTRGGMPLYAGWCAGDQRFRAPVPPNVPPPR